MKKRLILAVVATGVVNSSLAISQMVIETAAADVVSTSSSTALDFSNALGRLEILTMDRKIRKKAFLEVTAHSATTRSIPSQGRS